MGEKMTLERVRDWHRAKAKNYRSAEHNHEIAERWARDHDRMADAIDTHITQPAQAVDVDSLYEVIRSFGYTTRGQSDEIAEAIHHMLTAAIPKDSNGAEGVGS